MAVAFLVARMATIWLSHSASWALSRVGPLAPVAIISMYCSASQNRSDGSLPKAGTPWREGLGKLWLGRTPRGGEPVWATGQSKPAGGGVLNLLWLSNRAHSDRLGSRVGGAHSHVAGSRLKPRMEHRRSPQPRSLSRLLMH